MQNQLFRQKSLDRISSPEELHDYMRVTTPRLWMILATVVALLVGLIVYASSATLENTMNITVHVDTASYQLEEDGETFTKTLVTTAVPMDSMDQIKPGMTVRLKGETGKVDMLFSSGDEVNYLILMEKEVLTIPDGDYDAELVLESSTPISFLWN